MDTRGLANLTLNELVDWYFDDVGSVHRFGKNKTAVLRTWQRGHGHLTVADITSDYLTRFVRSRQKAGVSGVTISIDLTYLAGMLKSARDLRNLPIDLEPIAKARANMRHLKISSKSKERKRRPTEQEVSDLCDYLDKHSRLPMRDIILFACNDPAFPAQV